MKFCVDLGVSLSEEQINTLNYTGKTINISKLNDSKRRNPPNGCYSIVNDDGSVSFKSCPSISDSQLAQIENEWVSSEMTWISIQLDYHADLNFRAVSTETKLRKYRVTLCDYVQQGIITQPSRPQRPS